ncbi:MAG TPA: T9SS type A sorting domain-containing protein [Bacteroidales bacterium]|nr:T9SS type A sorting domain-containing protein [Bacteroidales bacterium]HSA43277.1 T9SS type A sorting domain-containing protein [Bacteroidales bacterium]
MQALLPFSMWYSSRLTPASTIQINQSEVYQAINTIAISNLTVDGNGSSGGSAEIKARNNVTLQSGFWAKSGSSVFVHVGPFILPCETWPDVLVESKSGPQNIAGDFASEFELHFDLEKDEADARIFPNPSDGKYHIELFGCTPENITVEVFDCLGRLIQTGNHTGNDALSIDLKDFPAGTYCIIIKTNECCVSRRLIKY